MFTKQDVSVLSVPINIWQEFLLFIDKSIYTLKLTETGNTGPITTRENLINNITAGLILVYFSAAWFKSTRPPCFSHMWIQDMFWLLFQPRRISFLLFKGVCNASGFVMYATEVFALLSFLESGFIWGSQSMHKSCPRKYAIRVYNSLLYRQNSLTCWMLTAFQ